MTNSTRCSVSTSLCSLLLMIQLLPLVPRPIVKSIKLSHRLFLALRSRKRGYVRFNRNLIPGQGPVVTKGSVDLILPLKSWNTSRFEQYTVTYVSIAQNLKIQSEYAPVRQHPASYRVRAYRANVRNTSCIKEMRISLKHRTIGPDGLDNILMHLNTGLNPEAAESRELCLSMNDSYRVDIECISTIVLSDYPFFSSG
ncbi:hypothetical protein L2E82_44767 [Cichorium intybus]|uniref:Uncharacterized protein n=1 Tax=Cichorium intybus TaxID=13427 RepID=A0ACB8ZS51_CICIN|nr:hypothetical protein L2E82_44767 [Cichorium intybus]